MNKSLILIGVSALIAVLTLKKSGSKKFSMDYISELIDTFISKYNFEVNKEMVLAVYLVESGGSFDNNIIGDLNKKYQSYGIMQVSRPALADSNKAYNLNISNDDLQTSFKKNLLAGTAYLNLCYESALKNAFDDSTTKWLAFKKYNGGVDTTLIVKSSANNYADKVYNLYLKLLSEEK